MTTLTLYLLLLKATLFSFSGFGSLPQVREDLVVRLAVVTDGQLNRSVLVGRTTPGPMGTYVVSLGYQAAGARGAVAGWLALATPAILIIPLMVVLERFAKHPRLMNGLGTLILASAVLLASSSIPLAAGLAASIRSMF